MVGAAGCCKALQPRCTFWIPPRRTDHPHEERKSRGLPTLSEKVSVGVWMSRSSCCLCCVPAEPFQCTQVLETGTE